MLRKAHFHWRPGQNKKQWARLSGFTQICFQSLHALSCRMIIIRKQNQILHFFLLCFQATLAWQLCTPKGEEWKWAVEEVRVTCAIKKWNWAVKSFVEANWTINICISISKNLTIILSIVAHLLHLLVLTTGEAVGQGLVVFPHVFFLHFWCTVREPSNRICRKNWGAHPPKTKDNFHRKKTKTILLFWLFKAIS